MNVFMKNNKFYLALSNIKLLIMSLVLFEATVWIIGDSIQVLSVVLELLLLKKEIVILKCPQPETSVTILYWYETIKLSFLN